MLIDEVTPMRTEMISKNTASVSGFTAKAGNVSDIQKDSVKTAVRKNKVGVQQGLAISIVEDMFPDYCQGEIQCEDIIDQMVEVAGLTKNEARKYFNDILKQILQDEF